MKQEAIIVCGNAGVGKSTLGRRLALEHRALLLDIDTVAERLVQAGLKGMGHDPDDRDSLLYKETFREPIHETLFALARENLAHLPCILVAPFTKERRDPDFLRTLESRLETQVRVICVVCDEATRKRRIEARGNPRDRYKLESWDEYASAGRDPGPPPFDHEIVKTSDPTPRSGA